MDEIFAILYDYSTRNLVFTRDAVERLLNIILRYENLQNRFFSEVSNDEIIDIANFKNENILAQFDMDTMIYVYYREILKSIFKKKYLSKYDVNLNDIAIAFKKNIMIIEAIFHETGHANELIKVLDPYDDSIETELYRYEYDFEYATDDISIFEYLNRWIVAHRYYDISFMERMAEISSLEKTATLLAPLDGELKILAENEIKIKEDFILKGYDENNLNGPTIRFLSKINCLKDFHSNDYPSIISKMSLEERLHYGFGITKEEYKRVKKI